MAASTPRVNVEIGGRTLSLSNLDKALYPQVGFTKAQVIDYYARIAPVLLPHITDRGLTLRRWPDGVEAEAFFEKRCAKHRPDWVEVAVGAGDRGGPIEYCRFTEAASLVWAANMAALELHAPMARCDDLETPAAVVFDLDPGLPASLVECCDVASSLLEVLEAVGLSGWPKVSGSKGLQVYVPLNTPHTHDQASGFALAVGQLLARQRPNEVVVTMAKSDRVGKVFVDWSQNSRHKTTIAPYSLRGRHEPTVSTPVSWDEVRAGAAGEQLVFGPDEVLRRVDEHGDLFAPVLTTEQRLPQPLVGE